MPETAFTESRENHVLIESIAARTRSLQKVLMRHLISANYWNRILVRLGRVAGNGRPKIGKNTCVVDSDLISESRVDYRLVSASDFSKESEIRIAISDSGRITMLLGASDTLNSARGVEAAIAERGADWEAFHRQVSQYLSNFGGDSYQPLIHPDLAYFDHSHQCSDRLDAIKNAVIHKGGSLLDIGANFGYFCFMLESEGFDCTAVEWDTFRSVSTAKIRDALRFRFEVINDDIESALDAKNEYDIVLALNFFHHFTRTKKGFDKMVRTIDKLHTNEVFFESSQESGASYYFKWTEDELVEFVRKRLNLSTSTKIVTCRDGRSVYHLH